VAENLHAIIDDMGRVIQSEIAVLSHRLYPAIVRRGLIPALQSLCDEFDATLRLELKTPPELVAAERSQSNLISERTRLAAYRISNEALTNIVKHAVSSRVTLSVSMSDAGWLTVSITDDGPGFDVQQEGGSLGLAAMRDYAEAVGGVCAILSQPGGGTSVVARLPASTA
jgi:signal transduction histidine kinase